MDHTDRNLEIVSKKRAFMAQLGITEEGIPVRIWDFDFRLHQKSGRYYSVRVGVEFVIYYKEITIDGDAITVDTLYAYKEQRVNIRLAPGEVAKVKMFRRRYVAAISDVEAIEEVTFVQIEPHQIRSFTIDEFDKVMDERETQFIQDNESDY